MSLFPILYGSICRERAINPIPISDVRTYVISESFTGIMTARHIRARWYATRRLPLSL
jgi:hypothetical protein